jgi:hypothetical protein
MHISHLTQNLTAIGTIILAIMAILSPLVFGLILPHRKRPRFSINFHQMDPYCRSTSANQIGNPANSVLSYWIRLRINNLGISAAKDCRGKLVSIYNANGQDLLNFDPTQLHWVTTSWQDPPFKDIDLDHLDHDYLDVLMTQQGDTKAYIAGDQFPLWTNCQPRGILRSLDPGKYILRITIYGDAVAPLTKFLTVIWKGTTQTDIIARLFDDLNQALAATKEVTMAKSEDKKEKTKNRWWNGLWGQLLVGLGQLFFAVVFPGMVLYVVAQYKTGNFQPFELATVAGLLGGFPLIAAFNEKVDDEGIKKRLKAVGGLYLFAAICFVVFGFYLAADEAKLFPTSGVGVGIFNVIYAATFYGGGLSLIFGMWMSLEIIPRLIGLGGIKDRVRIIFSKRK